MRKPQSVLLVVPIFILWSLGVVGIPYAAYKASSVFPGLVFLYLLLHGAIFAFALYLLLKNIAHKKRKGGKTHKLYSLLYVYILLSLALSFCFILKTLKVERL
jgi:hypothetical protein